MKHRVQYNKESVVLPFKNLYVEPYQSFQRVGLEGAMYNANLVSRSWRIGDLLNRNAVSSPGHLCTVA